ncbi:MAG: peptide chain release factor N(5)-glutamine methyltransferase [Herbinix sp.]|nr:peptide chain release factor N(5)-glutamine methyltransferase [Herbinix sp.]
MSTYKELLQTARRKLNEQKITDADIDAWYLFSFVFKTSRMDFMLQSDKIASETDSLLFMKLVKMREEHIPLQYITGSQEFMGLEFNVTQDVLIPRQDTEILVEDVLKICEGKSVLDMCTGSGCIIVSIAKLGKPKKAVGVDISSKALEIAAKNAVKNDVAIEYLISDLFEQVDGYFDIIVSNPPYIPTNEIQELMIEVKDHEPFIALDGNKDGLYFYRRIVGDLNNHLYSNGVILFEIGHNQGEAVKEILLQERFTDIIIKKDLSGLDRVISARKP